MNKGNNNYTEYLQDNADELGYQLDTSELSYDDLIEIMNSYFRSFSDGLDLFLEDYTSFSGNISDIEDKTTYIVECFKKIQYKINPQVVKGWFEREPRHNSDGRDKMFALCFALGFDIKTTRLFFQKVFLERCFDCHNAKEAALFFCMNNNLEYNHAIYLSDKLASISIPTVSSDSNVLYTRVIEEKINNIHDDEAFLEYIEKNISSFAQNRISAKDLYDRLLNKLKASTEDIELFKEIKDLITTAEYGSSLSTVNEKMKKFSSPCMREYCERAQKYKEYDIRRDFDSDNFVLAQILETRDTTKGIKKEVLPDIIKKNFAYRLIFNKISHMKDDVTYDMLRKQIILLFFYDYWIYIDEKPIPQNELAECFVQFLDDKLVSCGYERLYPGNAYDWLFLLFSTTEDPIQSLRMFYDSAIDDEV